MDGEALTQLRQLLAPEDEAIEAARQRAGQEPVPSPEVGSLLSWAARSVAARHVVEIGSAAGVSGLWLLRGMTDRGVLTSVEPDPHRHALATQAYEEAGVDERVRSILGEPGTVLARLSDGGYDLCLIDVDPPRFADHLAHALRLVRAGGLLVARGVLKPGPVDHAEALAGIDDEAASSVAVLPLDEGTVLAIVRGSDPDPA